MKRTQKLTSTIKEKIAFLEVLNDTISTAESMRDCYMETTDNGEKIVPTDDYNFNRYNAYCKLIAILEKEI